MVDAATAAAASGPYSGYIPPSYAHWPPSQINMQTLLFIYVRRSSKYIKKNTHIHHQPLNGVANGFGLARGDDNAIYRASSASDCGSGYI